MSDKLPYELSFTFNSDMWFYIVLMLPNRGIWRWQIKHPLSLERLDI